MNNYRKMDKKGHGEDRRVSFRAAVVNEDRSARYVYPCDEYYNSYLTPTDADSLQKSRMETYKVSAQ